MISADLPPAIPLESLSGPAELIHLGPDSTPRLLAVAPFPAVGSTIVFVHGLDGDPCNQWILIREAQARGMRVWTMAYETWAYGCGRNADGFAEALRDLAARGEDDVTIVAHSLGALTAKGALDRMRRLDGHLEGFRHVRFITLGAPWAGVTAADLSRHLFTRMPQLAYARDLAPGGAYWRGIMTTPLAPEVSFYSLGGSWDSYNILTWTSGGYAAGAAVLGQARRHAQLAGATHNGLNWDERAIAFVFDPDHAPEPSDAPTPAGWRTALREIAAILGFDWAFRQRGE